MPAMSVLTIDSKQLVTYFNMLPVKSNQKFPNELLLFSTINLLYPLLRWTFLKFLFEGVYTSEELLGRRSREKARL